MLKTIVKIVEFFGIIALCIVPGTLGGIYDNSVGTSEFPIIQKTYITEGTLYIPYAEIEEPFTAWVDHDNGMSRIDFYGGTTKTYQLGGKGEDSGDYGVMRKIVPMTNEQVTNQLTCFEVNGTKDSIVREQSVLPDPTGFKYVGSEFVNGQATKKYVLTDTKGQKVNKYIYWLRIERNKEDGTEFGIPIKYEMKGFNTLLGSHYDHYYLIYDWFTGSELIPADTFDVPESIECSGFPGPGHANSPHHQATFNPMKQFIHTNAEEHITIGFEQFITAHNKKYQHHIEKTNRLNIYRHNYRFIESKNRAGLSYRLGINKLADRTPDELKVLRGKLVSKGGGYNGGQPFPYNKETVRNLTEELPDSMDWRIIGAVTPVKDQSVCGSCWSFGTIGAVEGANFLKTHQLIRLSQQALIDCSWGFGNNGCDGGEDFRSYQWMMKHGGIPSADSYGPYLGIDGYCHAQNITPAVRITGFVNVTSGDEDALKLAIFKHGPISVAIDASHKTFSFYANGVYYEPKCGNKEDSLDHAVLAVGYGILGSQPYWLIKNSWSTYWGNDGYVLMSQRDNNCGVATSPTYVTL